ncbi:Hypothetical protein NTJ_01253 [Nesidiocoris tenuis]|uniref:Granulins domain-containing protein n=1 Tax=Nesidiocoris tenuis TaxID=355587 RepID=A0ABN7ADX1_9HEMI|nr:Hypothetical protein NTJ_01253 [Nesidiocoris tenuis]
MVGTGMPHQYAMAILRDVSFLLIAALSVATSEVDVGKDWCTSTVYCPDGTHCCSDKMHCCPIGRTCCLGDRYCCANDLSSVVNASFVTMLPEPNNHPEEPSSPEYSYNLNEEQVEIEKDWCTPIRYCPDGTQCCSDKLHCCPIGRSCCLGDRYCCANDLSSVVNASIAKDTLGPSSRPREPSHQGGKYSRGPKYGQADVKKEWCTSTRYCPDGYHCCFGNLFCCSYYDSSSLRTVTPVKNYGELLNKPNEHHYADDILEPPVSNMRFGDRRVQIVSGDDQYERPLPDFIRRAFPRTYNAKMDDYLNQRLDPNPVIIVQYVP